MTSTTKRRPPSEVKFSEREKRVFMLFWKAGFGKDIPIEKMYSLYHGLVGVSRTPSRAQQMSVGMAITRINRKLEGTKIVPGALKRTYRITQV